MVAGSELIIQRRKSTVGSNPTWPTSNKKLMIPVIVKRRGKEVWDGELSCCPVVGQDIIITEDGKEKSYRVESIIHDIDSSRRKDEIHIVYIHVI